MNLRRCFKTFCTILVVGTVPQRIAVDGFSTRSRRMQRVHDESRSGSGSDGKGMASGTAQLAGKISHSDLRLP